MHRWLSLHLWWRESDMRLTVDFVAYPFAARPRTEIIIKPTSPPIVVFLSEEKFGLKPETILW
jgi:hypothetical protein